MTIKNGIYLGLLAFISLSFLNRDLLEWSAESRLGFDDFKGAVPANIGNQQGANISTIISYRSSQEQGKTPDMTILNFMDKDASWMSIRKPEILKIMQIRFDYSELYARKIRKKMLEMNKSGIVDKQKYIDEIGKLAKISEKRQREASLLLSDQEELIKIMQKDIADSLNLYKNFEK